MKQWALTVVAVVSGIAIYKWWQHNKMGQGGSFLSVAIGTSGTQTGPYNDVAGVPVFDGTGVPNRPDQVSAALHTNDAATLSGSFQYSPAFGADENRQGGTPVF